VRRLPKQARRAQFLDVAYEIIKDEGTDALTLARLAERAGVSKPIAYDHFGTRAGLLAALFRTFEQEQVERMRTALDADGQSLRAVTEIAAAGYMDCLVSAGPEYVEVCAALLAYDETKDYHQESRDYFAEQYRRVFSPFVTLEGQTGWGVRTGLVGAAEALARDVYRGVITSGQATRVLADIMYATLSPLARNRSTKARPKTARRLVISTSRNARWCETGGACQATAGVVFIGMRLTCARCGRTSAASSAACASAVFTPSIITYSNVSRRPVVRW
jgi:AcrR family transcriptional regulator